MGVQVGGLDVVTLLDAVAGCHCWVPLLGYPSFRSSCILSLTRLMVVARTTKSYSLYCFSSLGLLCLALHAFTSAVICGSLRCGRL